MLARRRLLSVVLAVPLLLGTGAAEAAPPSPVQVVGLDVVGTARLLAEGRTTSVALVDRYLRRIDAYEDAYADQPGVNAIIAINPHAARRAGELDEERRRGAVRGPLHGVPLVLKDNVDVRGMATTGGSAALRGSRPHDDATQVRRLREAGAIVLAKTNMHEFAMDVTTVSSAGGQTRNPYDQRRHPGGSSGGTGAGVAAAFAPAGLGTDTCGSLRIPAAHTNLVTLRATTGLSSLDGVLPLAGSQDVLGPMATSVRDVAVVLDATAGPDPADPATAQAHGHVPPSYLRGLHPDALRGARLGVVTDYFGDAAAERPTNAVVRTAIADMTAAGAHPVELGPLPRITGELAESSRIKHEFEHHVNAYLARTPGPPELAGLEPPRDRTTLDDVVAAETAIPEVQQRLRTLLDSPALPNDAHDEALRRRDVLRRQLHELMVAHDLDALVYPSVSAPPTELGTRQSHLNCRLAAHSGFPALSVPAGFTPDGLPIGVELMGAPFAEPHLLALGHAYEQRTHHRVPPPTTPPLP
ncbi:amidase [Saccharopolyspora cebuensis]|uniref:Amidase n=1 Tax=Saccharopolyspora cebuensis TaxID=418759 RepID=A0ABV4CDV6_9PSEU